MTGSLKPPFNEETARAKVKSAQDVWNTCNPEVVAQAYTLILDGVIVQNSLQDDKR